MRLLHEYKCSCGKTYWTTRKPPTNKFVFRGAVCHECKRPYLFTGRTVKKMSLIELLGD